MLTSMQAQKWVVLKFGGSSVGEAAHWQTIFDETSDRLRQGYSPLLVLSALKNVSNLLEALLHQALAGVHPVAIEHLQSLHLGFASKLSLDIQPQLAPWFEQLANDCNAIAEQQTISPEIHASVLAVGELLSTTIGVAYLQSRQLSGRWLDARQLLQTQSQNDDWHHFTAATCDYSPGSPSERKLRTALASIAAKNPAIQDPTIQDPAIQDPLVVVTQGFIAADEQNKTVLLGREGSDTSAAYLGALLNASQVEIWTDVTGVFSANPREISAARALPELSYRHAGLMARFGAKVLHPRAIQPAAEHRIPLKVRCTGEPSHPGTLISEIGAGSSCARALASVNNVSEIILTSAASREKESILSNQIESAINSISALGFDFLLRTKFENKIHLIVNYVNGDAPQPDAKIIQLALDGAAEEINQKLSLISLIGKPSAESKKIFNQQLENSITNQTILRTFYGKQGDYISLLVDNQSDIQLSHELHHLWIEKE